MPLSNTIVDFWRMVYDYRCFNIVMLNEIDTDDMKQGQYWSDDSASIHGPFIIDVTSTVKHDNYIQRTFSLTNSKKVGVEPRVIGHFQVINWSQDSDVPIAKGVLAEVMQQVENSQHQYGNGPIVVQCRNGSGRSGIFCALMATCARMKAEQIIDVFQAVKTVRDNRTGMVESVDQYIRCYEEVLSYVECIDEED
uniref:Receptor-type tyrosine-protein phosphatase mu-like n=1 Tax=Saccoglossus kowalevskii TaxID=10224 RepID=A0ABM0LY20_SACKO|nr:PREDICTED: receptor-type tyrosine-protein phosphatase mu-like [Saccoglossus kowalevskii]